MLLTHVTVLQVVIPLLGAPACALLRQARHAWLFSLVICAAAYSCSVYILSQVWDGSVIRYAIGGWPAPWGIEYRIDTLNAILLFLVSTMALLCIIFARQSVEREIARSKQSLFYCAFLICLTGLLGILATGDAFNVFVFLEISSLSTYALISLGKDRRALVAAYQYLIMGTIGATFILIGIGLLYVMTGTLNMLDLAERIPEVSHTRTIQVACAFLTIGIGLKLAIFPLHLWLPNAYAYAPSVISAFLAATATKVAVYLLLRFFFTLFGAQYTFTQMGLHYVLLPLGLIAALSASLVAIYQSNVKRMLAYSSVAQLGYIIISIACASSLGVQAAVLHIFNHALMKGALFLALGAMVYRVGSCELPQLAGLGRRMPWTSAAFGVAGLSLIGVPLTAGFISKWYLLLAVLDQPLGGLLAVALLLSSLLAVLYIGRVLEVLYFRPSPEGLEQVQEAPLSLQIPLWILAAANLWFGLHTSLSLGAASRVAQQLLGGGL